ncbi:peptidase M23 [Capsulimonas corticalis]|uniref:Peptidase M23 n=1 Tax=Capsulimonas corticalis TaxID=2219043 RepID=A0A402CWX3_9BACT|nr:LysM peptidoglycan-binding domain-containing protein [Capsulimonas corticalis]BDI34268.1 peptidase M23 [Capsulimonas corticalis]
MALAPATLQNLENKKTFKCLFNPTEYTIAKTNNWKSKEHTGENVPKIDFTGGQSRSLKMKLFFDVFEEDGADVRTSVDMLWELALIYSDKQHPVTKKSRPPLCLFQWGPNWQFTAVVASLSVNYTLFREDGTPVRAMADVTFTEAQDDAKKKPTNPTSHGEGGRKRREVQPRDTLALIAFQEYGDANHWRRIADDNHLDDPRNLRPGQVLSIPPLS